MDQGIIEKMKKHYRRSLLRDMLLEKDEENLLTYLKNLNMLNCCNLIAMAWSDISPTNISRAWRKLIPSCDMEVENCTTITIDDIMQYLYRRIWFSIWF